MTTYHNYTDLPPDVRERLRKSIASVAVADRKHHVIEDPTTNDYFIVFEGYNIPIEFAKGIKA